MPSRLLQNLPTVFATTDRLVLRGWSLADLEPFAALNADPRVMEYFRAPISREQSDAFVHHVQSVIDEGGLGLWAVSLPHTQEFLGFVGLCRPSFEAEFTPCVEIGWRLSAEYWGKGYATEAALAALELGFSRFALREIVSFTTRANLRSRRVMEKIGMSRDPNGDFDHPKLPENHPLRPHVLYRASADSVARLHKKL